MRRNRKVLGVLSLVFVVSAILGMSLSLRAGEFTQKDLDRWEKEFISVVMEGEKVFHSPKLGSNKVSCDQCHPNAVNTHPETYPKFQQQIGKVVSLFEMVNWCIRNPLEGESLAADDPKMVALLSYITYERRGVPLAPGKH
jgi:thiosulfate dehydrogenase